MPSFRHHKATGQGCVVLNGQAVYLGRCDDPATEQKYHQVVAERDVSRAAAVAAEIG